MTNSTDAPSFRFDTESLRLAALQAQVLARCRGVLNHDMRNAVQGIHAGIELIARTTNPAIAAKVTPAECIAMLKEQLVNLQSTLERMVSDTTLGAEKPVRFDVVELLNSALRLLRHEPGIPQARLDLPANAYALARIGLVRTVLLALLFEAADHVRGAGKIAIELRVGEQMELRIISMSAAAAPAQEASVFEVTNSILEREGGSVLTERTESTCTVRMRLKPAEALVEHKPATGIQGIRVLVADAHRDAADTLSMLLQIEGCETRVAYDSAATLRITHEFRPNLVLLDSGLNESTAEQLHRASPDSNLKIIEMSQNARGTHEGVDGHVKKPIEFAALKGVLAVARQS
jgi:CheY-like chemotaxis protein